MLSVWTDFGCSDVAMQHCSRAVNLGICLHTTIKVRYDIFEQYIIDVLKHHNCLLLSLIFFDNMVGMVPRISLKGEDILIDS